MFLKYKKKLLKKMKTFITIILVCNFINLLSALTFDVIVLRNKVNQSKSKSKFY